MIEIENVAKSYGRVTALRGLSLRIGEGEFFGLLGPNGAGKSTLMHILSGLLRPDSGTVRFGGTEARDTTGRACLLGLAPQQIALYLDLSAWANVEIFGGLHGLKRRELRERGGELLELVGLYGRRHEKVKAFSGGMQRRLNLAVSLLHRPRYLLCDEPTTGVDLQSRNAIFEFLEARNREGLTIVYTTHYMEEVERLCRRVGIIDGGRVLAVGTRYELMADVMAKRGNPVPRVEVRGPSLEDLFLELTGKDLRE
jgi:ABC-2 type transport system ATP-binding protein